MKKVYRKLYTMFLQLYAKINNIILSVMVLGLLELGAYYEVIISFLGVLAPEAMPILVIVFLWIAYKGIKKLYLMSKNKNLLFF